MKLTHTVGGIALSLGLGCSGAPPASGVDQDLARLTALDIVNAPQLVLTDTSDTERARQAARLDRLVAIAEDATHNQYLPPHTASEADAAVQALSALQIVQVAGLIIDKPANNPSCYGLVCPADQAAADAANARRVTLTFGIAAAAQEEGL
jgi:hypothetical protein